MATKTFTGMLYTKAFTGKDGNKFVKHFLKYEDKTFDCTLKNTLKAKTIAEGWAMPSTVTFGSEDYFVKERAYTRKDGTQGKAHEIVLLNVLSHEPTSFPKISLDDLD